MESFRTVVSEDVEIYSVSRGYGNNDEITINGFIAGLLRCLNSLDLCLSYDELSFLPSF